MQKGTAAMAVPFFEPDALLGSGVVIVVVRSRAASRAAVATDSGVGQRCGESLGDDVGERTELLSRLLRGYLRDGRGRSGHQSDPLLLQSRNLRGEGVAVAATLSAATAVATAAGEGTDLGVDCVKLSVERIVGSGTHRELAEGSVVPATATAAEAAADSQIADLSGEGVDLGVEGVGVGGSVGIRERAGSAESAVTATAATEGRGRGVSATREQGMGVQTVVNVGGA